MDAQFLICKINFMLLEYNETLKCVNQIEQDSSNFDGPCRRLKMSADLFAIKGRIVLIILCLMKHSCVAYFIHVVYLVLLFLVYFYCCLLLLFVVLHVLFICCCCSCLLFVF